MWLLRKMVSELIYYDPCFLLRSTIVEFVDVAYYSMIQHVLL